MYDPWKPVEISTGFHGFAQMLDGSTYNSVGHTTVHIVGGGVYIPCVPTCTKGDLHRPLVGWLVGCESWCGGGVGALYCVHVVVPVVHCIVLEFPDSVHTQGQNHHVSVNCGASSVF